MRIDLEPSERPFGTCERLAGAWNKQKFRAQHCNSREEPSMRIASVQNAHFSSSLGTSRPADRTPRRMTQRMHPLPPETRELRWLDACIESELYQPPVGQCWTPEPTETVTKPARRSRSRASRAGTSRDRQGRSCANLRLIPPRGSAGACESGGEVAGEIYFCSFVGRGVFVLC